MRFSKRSAPRPGADRGAPRGSARPAKAAAASPTTPERSTVPRLPSDDAFDLAPVGLLILDERGVIVRANRAAAALLGVARSEVEGRASLGDFVTASDRPAFGSHLASVATRGGARDLSIHLRTRSGGSQVVHVRSIVRGGGLNAPLQIHSALLEGADRRVRAQGRALAPGSAGAASDAPIDRFWQAGQAALDRTRATHQPFSVVTIDLDHFGRLAERHGPVAATQFLENVQALARRHLRDRDLLAGVDGDGFVVILPGAGAATAVRVAERIRSALEHTDVALGTGRSARRTASFGVATAEPTDDDLEDLLLRAEIRMHAAKEEGRNRVVGL